MKYYSGHFLVGGRRIGFCFMAPTMAEAVATIEGWYPETAVWIEDLEEAAPEAFV